MAWLSRDRILEFVLLTLASLYLFGSQMGPPIDYDLWFFIRMGRHILETGFIPHNLSFLGVDGHFPQAYLPNDEWAFGCLVFLVFRTWSYVGLAYTLATFILAEGLLVYLCCRLVRIHYIPALCLTAFGLELMSSRFILRPQILADCFLSALVALLLASLKKPRLVWLAPLAIVGWTTFHASVVLGLAVVCGWCLGSLVDRRGFWSLRNSLALVALAFAAACCRPGGPYLFVFIVEHFGANKKLDWITEWWPIPKMWPTWYLSWPGLFVALFLIGVAVSIYHKRFKLTGPVLICGLLFLAFRFNRGVGELAAGGIPLLAWLWSDIKIAVSPRLTAAAAVLMTGLLAYGIATLAPVAGSYEPPDYIYPIGAVHFLEEHAASEPARLLFCSYQFGSFLVFHDRSVFLRSMSDFYSDQVVRAYWSLRDNPAQLDEYVKRYGIGGFVLHYEFFDDQKHLIETLDNSPNWRLVYWDDLCLLYLPANLGLPAYRFVNPAFLERMLAHPQQSKAELERYLLDAPKSSRGLKLMAKLVTAQKDDSALSWWDRLIEVSPRDGEAYLERGRIRYSQQDWNGARADLRLASEINPDSDLANFNFAIALLRSAQEADKSGDSGRSKAYKAEAVKALKRASNFPPAAELARRL